MHNAHIFISGTEYDITVHSLPKFLNLAMNGNPNFLEVLYVDNILFSNEVGQLVRENRDLFLSKLVWNTFRGFAKHELHKDKLSYHTIRLLIELKQILKTHTLNLKSHSSFLKTIKEGNIDRDSILHLHNRLLEECEEAKDLSTLPDKPDNKKIKQLLLNCLEIQYGSLNTLTFKNT